jgi:hypothetical protein
MNENLKAIIARLGQAFTNEDAAFNFPIKYPAIDLDKPTKEALYKTAGIIAGGLIIMGFIISSGKKK